MDAYSNMNFTFASKVNEPIAVPVEYGKRTQLVKGKVLQTQLVYWCK